MIAITALGLVAILTVLTTYVIARTGPEIGAARKILSGNVANLTPADISLAQEHIRNAHDILHGLAATILRIVPIERQNVDAVRDEVNQALPTLTRARVLREQLAQLQRGGLIRSRRIPIGQIRHLQAPLMTAGTSVTALVNSIREHLSGWLIPTIWDGMKSTLVKAEELQRATTTAADVARLAPDLLGASGTRTYLVLLMNNAEVRPSGGIVSGIGLVKLDRGRIHLGPFHYYTDLAQKPYRSVTAPADFVRRYGRFKADTTRWVNVTLSPDTEDVAQVAARLYQVTAGEATDGAILVDPKGVAALLPRRIQVHVPGTTTHLTNRNLPPYVYSKAYRKLGGHTTTRHDAMIAIGEAAFKDLTSAGFGGQDQVSAASHAVAAGHVRFVSFNPSEEAILDRAGVTGALRGGSQDRVFVTQTNFNQTKLDFWSHEGVVHTCDVREEDATLCETAVDLTNSAPEGLSRYVAGDHPYGQLRSFLEVYVPGNATLQRVLLDGQPATFSEQREAGLRSVGVEVRLPPGETGHFLVDYSLPESPDGYSLEITPAPMSHDADLRVTLRVPLGWRLSGAAPHGSIEGGVYHQAGPLSHPQTIEAGPYAVRGLSSVWQALNNFWHSSIF